MGAHLSIFPFTEEIFVHDVFFPAFFGGGGTVRDVCSFALVSKRTLCDVRCHIANFNDTLMLALLQSCGKLSPVPHDVFSIQFESTPLIWSRQGEYVAVYEVYPDVCNNYRIYTDCVQVKSTRIVVISLEFTHASEYNRAGVITTSNYRWYPILDDAMRYFAGERERKAAFKQLDSRFAPILVGEAIV